MMESNAAGHLSNPSPPCFLITVDTEGDNLWSQPTRITTRNAGYLERFQGLCESYGFRPTYLVNYEMALCPIFRAFGRDVLQRNVAEIGMHLHAWNSPPVVPLTANDDQFQPYLIEYPYPVMVAKISYMTELLEDTFGVKMLSHRAGRWAFNEAYARILVEQGYRVDCSVTPYQSWKKYRGDPRRRSGTDFFHFPDHAYFVDLEDISRPGAGPLLEVPVTIVPIVGGKKLRRMRIASLALRAFDKVFPPRWLRARPNNLRDLRYAVARANQEKRDYIEYAVHSSELMPGGSPKFRDQTIIDSLYRDLETMFLMVKDRYKGATLSDYYHKLVSA